MNELESIDKVFDRRSTHGSSCSAAERCRLLSAELSLQTMLRASMRMMSRNILSVWSMDICTLIHSLPLLKGVLSQAMDLRRSEHSVNVVGVVHMCDTFVR